MKTVQLILLLLIASLGRGAAAQALKLAGQVTNAETGAPIAYASVGVMGRPFGATADEQGRFAFSVAPSLLAATEHIIVSCVGYQEQQMRVGDFATGSQTIRLAAKGIALNEVSVSRKGQARARQFGHATKGWSYHYQIRGEPKYFQPDEEFPAAVELGILLNLNRKEECFLDDLNFYIEENFSQDTKLRVNVYDVVDGLPHQLISQQDMIFDVPDDATGWMKFDLRKYNVPLAGLDEAVVTIQWVAGARTKKRTRSGRLIAANLGIAGNWPAVLHSYVYRAASQAPWGKQKTFWRGVLSFYVNTTCYKQE